MFTVPASSSGGIILVARPSASSGTITNAGNAYDLPASKPDDYPFTTSADRALVTGSAVAGTVDYVTVEYNTFPTRSKANFTQCSLNIGMSASLVATCLSVDSGIRIASTFVSPSLGIEYQVNGTNWVKIDLLTCLADGTLSIGTAANETASIITSSTPFGEPLTTNYTKIIRSVTIPASSFTSNLNNLKVRFKLGTCTNSLTPAFTSSGSYNIWDIRANIS